MSIYTIGPQSGNHVCILLGPSQETYVGPQSGNVPEVAQWPSAIMWQSDDSPGDKEPTALSSGLGLSGLGLSGSDPQNGRSEPCHAATIRQRSFGQPKSVSVGKTHRMPSFVGQAPTMKQHPPPSRRTFFQPIRTSKKSLIQVPGR